MSYLATVFAELAALAVPLTDTVAYGDITPQVLYLDTLPNGAPGAKLPARLLRALRTQEGGGRAFAFEFGNVNIARVTWRVYDLLLWRPLQQGLGLGSHEADLVNYVDVYTVSVLQQFQEPHSRARLMSADIVIGEFNFPEGSEHWYAGVEVALDVEERLPETTAAALQVIQNRSRPANLISAEADNALTLGDDDLLYVPESEGGGLGYTVYAALITQNGTSDPVAQVIFENTLGDTVVWQRLGDKSAFFTRQTAGSFKAAKTWISVSGAETTKFTALHAYTGGTNLAPKIYVYDVNAPTTPVDSWVLYIEIRVYP